MSTTRKMSGAWRFDIYRSAGTVHDVGDRSRRFKGRPVGGGYLQVFRDRPWWSIRLIAHRGLRSVGRPWAPASPSGVGYTRHASSEMRSAPKASAPLTTMVGEPANAVSAASALVCTSRWSTATSDRSSAVSAACTRSRASIQFRAVINMQNFDHHGLPLSAAGPDHTAIRAGSELVGTDYSGGCEGGCGGVVGCAIG